MDSHPQDRRRFVTRIASVLGVAATTLGIPRPAKGESARAAQQRELHELDKWIGQLTGEYRLVLDAVTPRGVPELTQYASTYLMLNASTYGMPQTKSTLVVIVRNMAAAFGFNSEAWSTFALGEHAQFNDPRGGAPAVRNVSAGSLSS